MMHKKLLTSLLLVFLLQSFTTQSQESGDLALWSVVGVDYKLNKKIKFILEQHLRMKNDIRDTDEYFTELTIDYELFKDFEITAGFRHITENDDQGKKQGFENHFRWNFDISYKYKIKQLDISHRIRYQNKNQLGVSLEDGDEHRQNLRFKTDFEYKIKNWPLDPEFAVEIFNRFSDEEKINLNKYRLTLGTSYDIKKIGEFGIYYRIENGVDESFDGRLKIIGLKYRYSLN